MIRDELNTLIDKYSAELGITPTQDDRNALFNLLLDRQVYGNSKHHAQFSALSETARLIDMRIFEGEGQNMEPVRENPLVAKQLEKHTDYVFDQSKFVVDQSLNSVAKGSNVPNIGVMDKEPALQRKERSKEVDHVQQAVMRQHLGGQNSRN